MTAVVNVVEAITPDVYTEIPFRWERHVSAGAGYDRQFGVTMVSPPSPTAELAQGTAGDPYSVQLALVVVYAQGPAGGVSEDWPIWVYDADLIVDALREMGWTVAQVRDTDPIGAYVLGQAESSDDPGENSVDLVWQIEITYDRRDP